MRTRARRSAEAELPHRTLRGHGLAHRRHPSKILGSSVPIKILWRAVTLGLLLLLLAAEIAGSVARLGGRRASKPAGGLAKSTLGRRGPVTRLRCAESPRLGLLKAALRGAEPLRGFATAAKSLRSGSTEAARGLVESARLRGGAEASRLRTGILGSAEPSRLETAPGGRAAEAARSRQVSG